ncbi:DUF2510 domain-containing protein [Arthrobacter sp. CJ23]|uniref:DUF2510 domain-containing protein n=1 Tax=Arthrobacter sp. CJ23 TaxID=2972479 RepID=UPI00215D04E2|nr:DUF2510 domain-containing protein [Arthrobacter sp. CJ23]UVJ38717.1 DUF2510 domain-containing protein [Arthrobacter sp. CJ23]
MTQPTNGSTTPPGWYPDPSDPRQMRWWDGARWTAHLAPATAQSMPQQRVPISNQTPVYNAFIWTIALLPVLPALLLLTWNPEFRVITTPRGMRTMDPTSIFSPSYFLLMASGFLTYGLSVLFAYFDHQRLAQSGVVRPFHWAWCFLSGTVYVIGRTVIVRKVAPDRGLWPIWILIATVVLAFTITAIKVSVMMTSMYSQFGYSLAV